MKDKHKIFIIALLLSLICSLGAVAASEDIAFEQSMNEEDVEASNQNIKEINMKISSKENEALNSPLNVNGTTFDNISKTISDAHEGDTIFLDGKTYTGNGSAIFINKNITLIGGSDLNDTKYATLDAKFLSNIIVASSPVTIKGIIFINGNSTMGGAINADGDFITIENCTFKNNHVYRDYNLYYGYGYGGAVYLNGENGTISDCTFINNTAENGGGIHLNGNLCTIEDSTFINNSACDGGALYFSGENSRIKRNKFRNNYAEFGGAIYSYGDLISISNNVFENNRAKNIGGAISCSSYKTNISDCTFTNNSAKSGGAFYCSYNSFYLSNSVFTSNNANSSGGAVENGGSASTIYNCSFNSNFITPDLEYSQGGGAIYTHGENLRIIESTFTKNKAETGSAILNAYQYSYLYNCKFIDNQADVNSLYVRPGFSNIEYATIIISKICSDNPLLKGLSSQEDSIEIVNGSFIENGETTNISSNITPRIGQGDVIIYLNGTLIYTQDYVEDGIVIIPLKNLSHGSGNIRIVLKNESGDAQISKNTMIPGTGTEMELIMPDYIAEGEPIEFKVILPADATGNVIFRIDNQTYNQTIVPGKSISLKLSNLTIGDYLVEVEYSGDEKYWGNWQIGFLTVSNIAIRANNTHVTVVVPTNATGNITVFADNKIIYSNPLADKTLIIPYNMTPGEHNITVVIKDTNGNNITETRLVSFNKLNPNMAADIPEFVNKGETFYVKVTLPDDATGDVEIYDGYEFINSISITGGTVTIPVSNLTGKHIITVRYTGDEKYKSEEIVKTTTMTKLAIAAYIEVEKEFTRVATDFTAGERGAYFYAILKDQYGKILINKKVQIAINGPVYTVTTDEQGRAAIMINLASANTYTYALFFQGDQQFNASLLGSSKLVVTKKPMYITASNQVFKASATTKTISVKLTTSKNEYDGKMYLKDGKSVTLTINGKTYTSKSDAKGVVKFNIGGLTKKGTYSAVIKFAGDRTYNAASKTITVTLNDKGATTNTKTAKETSTKTNLLGSSNNNAVVKSAATQTSNVVSTKKNTVLEVAKEFTRVSTDYNAGERGAMFYAVLKDTDGNVLANKTVQIAVNGPIYNVTTDSQGRAGLMVNLASANTYTYALSFSGDSEYNAAALVWSKLVVTKKPITIAAKDQTFTASAKTKTVSATLQTSKNAYDGKTYIKAGKKVTLKINGKTFTSYIDSKGNVKFNIGSVTKKGTYSAVISFAGDQGYNSATKTIKITLK